MTFSAVVPGRFILWWGGLFSFFFRKAKRVLVFGLMAGLLPALLASTAVAQTYTNIPIFQFAAFYNLDLDFSPGQPITLNGKVHVNGTLWMCPQVDAYFNDIVEATLLVTNRDNPNDQQNLAYNSSYRHIIPLPGGNPRSFVDPLNLLVPGASTNMEFILALPPAALGAPNAAAYDPLNQVFLYNECDLIISNSITGTNGARGTNIAIYYQDKDWPGGPLCRLTNNEVCTFSNTVSHLLTNGPISLASLTNKIIASYFPFVTNVAFYDYREGKTVQAVQIDIAKLTLWLTNTVTEGSNWNRICGGASGMSGNKGHSIDSIYVYNSVPLTGTTLPAVRLVNGQKLPTQWGLTIATPMPIYTLGDFNIRTNASGSTSVLTTNTAWTWPAALMGDAVTILSSSWSDAYTSGTVYSARTAVSTTVNAACLEGIVPSTKVGSTKHYSGGLENFLRLLENWTGDTLCYNGSIVALFPSIYATNYWIGPGTYYGVPTRMWGFDANFTSPYLLPPLTPLIGYTNPPLMVVQPQSQAVASGNTVVFTAMVSGPGPLAYLWSFKGTNIAGATNTSLMLTNVQFSQAGSYRVQVTNGFGSILSSNAVLTVAQPPSISVQPTDQTVLLNGTAIFGVTATGSSPLHYQWKFNGTNLDGATNDFLMLIMNLNTNYAGCYVVVITNLVGSVTSSVATLTVALSPSIIIQLTNQAVLSGSNVTFSVTVTGTGPFTYHWSINGVRYPHPLVAGNGIEGYSGDNGPATNAMLDQPSGLAVNKLGEVYIADYQNNRIRKVDTNGIITTVAGNGSGGFFGDGGPATDASLWYPRSVTVDLTGNLYIADSYNNRIRKVDTNGIIATSATVYGPTSLAVDSTGNLYINDCYNNCIRKMDANGIITTMAGNGSASYSGDGGVATNASLNWPIGVAMDVVGNLYIADRANNRIRKVDTNGIITTVAGNGVAGSSGVGGMATNASLGSPNSIAVDAVGNLYIGGLTNCYVCKVDTNGVVSGIAVTLHAVSFVAVDAGGNLYVDDTMGHQTRLEAFVGPTLTLTNVDLSDAGSYSVLILTPYGYVFSSDALLSVYATAAATLGGGAFSGDNQFQFQIAGVPGFNYAVQGSTNLIDWISLITNTAPFVFADTNAAGFPQQFYRAIYEP